MTVRLALSQAFYPRACIEDAINAYLGLCSVKVCDTTESGCWVEITGHVGADEQRVIHEFLNYLLDVSLEKHLTTT